MHEQSLLEQGNTSLQLQEPLLKNTQQAPEEKISWCESIVNFICCIYDQPDENEQRNKAMRASLKRNSFINNITGENCQEKNELILSGNFNDGYCSLLRLTQKNFFVDFKQLKKNQPKEAIYFQLLEQGTRFEPQEIGRLLPEKVLRYITKRVVDLNPSIVVDPMCWSNGLYLHICLNERMQPIDHIIHVLINKNIAQLETSYHNCLIYGVQKNVEFIQGDPIITLSKLKTKSGQLDVVYAHPRILFKNEPFSIHTHLDPPIKNLLPAMLLSTKNIIIVLPPAIVLSEVASCISYYVKQLDLEHIKFEIQKIQVDGYIECVVIYIGSIANVQNQNEIEALAICLVQDSNNQSLVKPTYDLLKKITQRVKFSVIMDLTLQAIKLAHFKSDTTLHIFINQLKKENIIDIDEIHLHFDAEENHLLDETPQYNHYGVNPSGTFDPNSTQVQKGGSIAIVNNTFQNIGSSLKPGLMKKSQPSFNYGVGGNISFQQSRQPVEESFNQTSPQKFNRLASDEIFDVLNSSSNKLKENSGFFEIKPIKVSNHSS